MEPTQVPERNARSVYGIVARELAGAAKDTLAKAMGTARVALVLGAEGEGMRHNTTEHCDQLARLPISRAVESLNVSNAAAIALYATAVRG